MSEVPKELATALRAACDAAEAVEKKGRAEAGYDFARALDIGAEARRLLKDHGIVLLPSLDSVDIKIARSGVLVIAYLNFEITYVKTGVSVIKKWAGSGLDNPGDKALYHAITGGRKYFVANLLEIQIGTDPEASGGAAKPDDREAARIKLEQDAAATQPDAVADAGGAGE